jgi:hypothetical protein
MEKKILVIFILILLISILAISVAGINEIKKTNVQYNTDDDWNYWSNPPHIYTIPNGNVGIGTSNPSAKLDIKLNGGGAATIGSSYTVALGNYAIAMGYGTNASGNHSTTMGKYTLASGSSATAMGWGTTASGSCSTAMGEDTTASGSFSTAMGRRIKVNGNYSLGIGLGTTPSTINSDHIMSIMGGKVGIGTTNPSRLLEVSGNQDIVAQFSGRVKGANAVNDDEFVTKGQIKNINIQYTPTGTSDPNGNVGDTSWDSSYIYVKTPEGWKRSPLETWESTPE